MKKLFLLLALLFGTVLYTSAQDTDGDGVADANDCSPTDPTKWASAIWIDQDGDGAKVVLTGCWGTLFTWSGLSYWGQPGIFSYHYCENNYCSGSYIDVDDWDNMVGVTDGTAIPVASGDADNDGEPDYSDPQPNNPLGNHNTLDYCNGIDDNSNGIIDEDCNGCDLTISAGADEHLFFGYTPSQCVTKTAGRTGGNSPYGYIWNLSRALLPGETMTGANTSSVTICLMDTAELCVTVSDANNCNVTDCAMIFAEDVRCFSGNNQKVAVCHNGNKICVDASAVAAHQGHGDVVGNCTASRIETTTEGNALSALEVFPNPATDKLSVRFNSFNRCNYSLLISDATGRVVLEKRGVALENANAMEVDLSFLSEGIYSLRFTSNEVTQQRKIVIQ
jgi:hypothetical protein